MTPEELRREIYENLLKRRIFYADRLEKLEKVLLQLNLIPKDQIYCSDTMLEAFKSTLLSDNESLLTKIYESVMNDKEEIWFDIYRSISNQQSGENSEIERKKQLRAQKRRKRLLKR